MDGSFLGFYCACPHNHLRSLRWGGCDSRMKKKEGGAKLRNELDASCCKDIARKLLSPWHEEGTAYYE
jgi:diadenosine tetraphosphatase ApaH/serine/threonine PP2A family protein phosphatase